MYIIKLSLFLIPSLLHLHFGFSNVNDRAVLKLIRVEKRQVTLKGRCVLSDHHTFSQKATEPSIVVWQERQ